MGKKRSREDAKVAREDRMADGSSDEEDFDVVNVEFEWFNFDSDIDFHGTKSLLRQLLDVDAQLFDISGLAEVILSQTTIGSTVKVDGKSTDPYALLTAVSLREQREKPAMAALTQYLAQKAAATPSLTAGGLPDLLAVQQKPAASPEEQKKQPHVGLVLAERLINMPGEIAPPMFSMLIDELEAAVEDGEPYEFTHYLIVSKTYQEVKSSLDGMVIDEDESNTGGKRKKQRSSGPSSSSAAPTAFHFHPEDEVLQKHALAYGTYEYTKDDENVADSKRAFQELGIKTHGLMMLIEASKFEGAVKAINEYMRPPQ